MCYGIYHYICCMVDIFMLTEALSVSMVTRSMISSIHNQQSQLSGPPCRNISFMWSNLHVRSVQHVIRCLFQMTERNLLLSYKVLQLTSSNQSLSYHIFKLEIMLALLPFSLNFFLAPSFMSS